MAFCHSSSKIFTLLPSGLADDEISPSDAIVILLAVDARREELTRELEAYYRGCGWKVRRDDDGTVRAVGPDGVMWIGLPVVVEDLAEGFDERLRVLVEIRMDSGGERCPLEVLPDDACADEVRAILARLGLGEMVSVYSLAA